MTDKFMAWQMAALEEGLSLGSSTTITQLTTALPPAPGGLTPLVTAAPALMSTHALHRHTHTLVAHEHTCPTQAHTYTS